MEKSFLTFVATYPTWEPSPEGVCVFCVCIKVSVFVQC
jgi:hypothetical protein